MNGVTLRCANCGTTQSKPGECEACHEQQVQFYCTRHTPGLWLKTPVCTQCGAEFGKDHPLPPREPRRALPPGPRPTGRPRPSDVPETRLPPRPGPWGEPASRPAPPGRHPRDARTTIERLLREHYRRRSPRTEDIEIARGSLAPVVAGGCLRIILLAFLIMMVAMYVLSSLGGMFLIY